MNFVVNALESYVGALRCLLCISVEESGVLKRRTGAAYFV